MPWGFVAAAAVGAAGSIIAGGEQASGQKAAANTQAGMFNTVVGQEQPFLQGGYGAETSLINYWAHLPPRARDRPRYRTVLCPRARSRFSRS